MFFRKIALYYKVKITRLWRYQSDEILTVQSINNIAAKDIQENLPEIPSEKSTRGGKKPAGKTPT